MLTDFFFFFLSIRYGSSFRFAGDYVDKKPFDATSRRKTRIIAIDALLCPGKRQYGVDFIVRYTLY